MEVVYVLIAGFAFVCLYDMACKLTTLAKASEEIVAELKKLNERKQ
jgi:cytochrome c oxidase assembly protein Cox11